VCPSPQQSSLVVRSITALARSWSQSTQSHISPFAFGSSRTGCSPISFRNFTVTLHWMDLENSCLKSFKVAVRLMSFLIISGSVTVLVGSSVNPQLSISFSHSSSVISLKFFNGSVIEVGDSAFLLCAAGGLMGKGIGVGSAMPGLGVPKACQSFLVYEGGALFLGASGGVVSPPRLLPLFFLLPSLPCRCWRTGRTDLGHEYLIGYVRDCGTPLFE
jgi:hypothetical protein